MFENVMAFSSSNRFLEAIFIAMACIYLSIALACLSILYMGIKIMVLFYALPLVFLVSFSFSYAKKIVVVRKPQLILSMILVLLMLAYLSNFIVVPLHGIL
ncbi:MAG: hypothetical protein ACP5RM_00460 [Candidatus Micrarchaeia archaeon]